MYRRHPAVGAVVLAVSAAILIPAAFTAPASAQGNAPGRSIVVLREGASPEGVLRRHGVAADHVYRHALQGFAAPLNAVAIRRLLGDADVAFIEPDQEVHTFAQTLPTGVDRMGADENPHALNGPVNVDVAIIDTGIDQDHPDLNVVQSVNFSKGKSADDGNGHGTHCAGIVGALDNAEGVRGVAPGVRLWGVRVLNNRGSGTIADVVKGVDFVTDNAEQIAVANMSLGAGGTSEALELAIQASVAAGVVYVVAAGNESQDASNSIPASYAETITVSALADFDGLPGGLAGADDDTLADFSNHGAIVDLAGPGVDILSTYKDGDYRTLSGTSMASPHVAGAAALLIAGSPTGRDFNDDGQIDGADVEAIRLALTSAAEPQIDWGPANTQDPDAPDHLEGLVDVTITDPDAPTLEITSPDDGAGFAPDTLISFAATATAADGMVLSGSIVWTSSLDGDLHIGASFGTTTLNVGPHRITATATDLAGRTASASVNVGVGAAPVVSVTFADSDGVPGTTFGRREKLTFTVAVTDSLTNAPITTPATVHVEITAPPVTQGAVTIIYINNFDGTTTDALYSDTYTTQRKASGTYEVKTTVTFNGFVTNHDTTFEVP